MLYIIQFFTFNDATVVFVVIDHSISLVIIFMFKLLFPSGEISHSDVLPVKRVFFYNSHKPYAFPDGILDSDGMSFSDQNSDWSS